MSKHFHWFHFFCWIDFYRNKFFNRYFLLYNKKIDSLENRNYKGCTLYICFHISDYVLKLCVEIFFFLIHHQILHIVYSLYYTNLQKNAFFSQQCLQSQFTTVEKDISDNTHQNQQNNKTCHKLPINNHCHDIIKYLYL